MLLILCVCVRALIIVIIYRRINTRSQKEGFGSFHAAGVIHPQFGNFVRIKLQQLKMS